MNQKILALNYVSEQFLSEPLTEYWRPDKENPIDNTYCFVISDKIKKMLLDTKTPRHPNLFKLPFNNIFLDVRLENDKVVLPYGIFIATCDDLIEKGDEDERGFAWNREYHIYFPYYFKGFEKEPFEFIHLSFYGCIEPIKEECYLEDIWSKKTIEKMKAGDKDAHYRCFLKEMKPSFQKWVLNNTKDLLKEYENKNDKEGIERTKRDLEMIGEEEIIFADHPCHNYPLWNLLNQKQIISFICNYLLFLNDPRVKQIVHKGRSKNFKKSEYFFEYPKSVTIILNNELQKYIDNHKSIPSGVKFHYGYRFLVRGHFRTLRAKRFKFERKIWILPHYRGKGLFVQKEYKLTKEGRE